MGRPKKEDGALLESDVEIESQVEAQPEPELSNEEKLRLIWEREFRFAFPDAPAP